MGKEKLSWPLLTHHLATLGGKKMSEWRALPGSARRPPLPPAIDSHQSLSEPRTDPGLEKRLRIFSDGHQYLEEGGVVSSSRKSSPLCPGKNKSKVETWQVPGKGDPIHWAMI